MIPNRLLLVIIIVLAGALCLPAAGATNWPNQVYAPYIDISLSGVPTIDKMCDDTGVKYYTCCFITGDADNNNNPMWGWQPVWSDDGAVFYKDKIDALRAKGGDVIISFGGAYGEKTELAVLITDVDRLTDSYRSIIDAYEVNYIDFDIEGGSIGNKDANNRRNQAIVNLQKEKPDLKVSFTLPVTTQGLTGQCNDLIKSIKADGVRIDRVNIMLMDYEPTTVTPPPSLGEYDIQAANGLHDQLKQIYPEKTDAEIWKMVGLTPMIGQNDPYARDQIFNLDDARTLAEFAGEKGVGMMSIWAASRDNGGCPGDRTSTYSCSGIAQTDYEFSNIFKNYASMRQSATPAPISSTVWPDQLYAPYINIEMWVPPTINDAYDATGVKYYSLGFVNVKDGNLRFGDHTEADYYKDKIDALRANGGDVIISFGGAYAETSEPAYVIKDIDTLVEAYSSVIDTYGVNYIDFDIEGGLVQDKDAAGRRSQAILKLREKYPNLKVSTTIAVMPFGLTGHQINYLEVAKEAEAEYKKITGKDVLIFDRVNIMLMDYGDDYKGDMGQYAIEAATNTNKQLSEGYYSGKSDAGIWSRMGLIPMIGQNDNQYEIFTLENARTLGEFAGDKGAGMMSIWAVHRDNGDCPGTCPATAQCSGIAQEKFEFTNILKDYASMRPSATPAPISSTVWPDQFYAPYIDYGLWQGCTINEVYDATGVKYFTCAFITVNGDGELRFNGHNEADYRLSDIKALRAKGGDVIISFGGADGQTTEPATVITDLDALVDAYSSVIETYGVNYIDFDIEGGAVTNHGANSRRNHAIIKLKEKYPDLKVSTTLAVSTVGFTGEGLAFLSDAKSVEDKYSSENPGKDVLIYDRVNIMLMDYGSEFLGDMGQYALDASNGVHRQLSQGYYSGKSDAEIWKRMGLTPMIGQNDQVGEIFTLDNAKTLAEFAGEKGVGMMSVWAMTRDTGECPGNTEKQWYCSGVEQELYQFSNIFKDYPSMRPSATEEPTPEPTHAMGLITPTPTKATGLLPEWKADKEYDTGEIVLYGGSMYAARWWTIDEEPGVEYVWLSTSGKLIPKTDHAKGLIIQWHPDEIYLSGDTVIYDDGVYSAKWLTMDEKPGETYVWELTSEIEPDEDEVPVTDTVTPTETPATGLIPVWESKNEYDGGDTVYYKGHTYTARWWNVAEPPGHTYSWMSDEGRYVPTPTPSVGPAKPWVSKQVYAAGDLVIYQQNRYRASWMNRDEIPGEAYVWELAPEEPTPAPTSMPTTTPTYATGLLPQPTHAKGLITPTPTPATGLLGE